MDIGMIFRDYRDQRLMGAAPDPFAGMEALVFELGAAAASVLALTSSIEAARTLRQMESMNVDARELCGRVKQLAIMAESLQGVTKTHVERGVK